MANYKLTPAAKADLNDIWRYSIDTWGRDQAIKYRGMIKQAVKSIADSPLQGRARDDVRPGYRAFKTGKHLIFYRAVSNWIEVVRVLHEQMDTGNHL